MGYYANIAFWWDEFVKPGLKYFLQQFSFIGLEKGEKHNLTSSLYLTLLLMCSIGSRFLS